MCKTVTRAFGCAQADDRSRTIVLRRSRGSHWSWHHYAMQHWNFADLCANKIKIRTKFRVTLVHGNHLDLLINMHWSQYVTLQISLRYPEPTSCFFSLVDVNLQPWYVYLVGSLGDGVALLVGEVGVRGV